MLLVSFLLVIVATIFLLSGLFFTQDLPLIFISIGCSALAGLVLVVAVLRNRPRQGPTAAVEGPHPAEGPAPAEVPVGTAGRPAAGRSAGREFPIPNYDNLEVVEVLPLLGELEAADLEMVRQREASGRAHPWVLARIDALLESEAETGELEWSTPADRAGTGAGTRRADDDWAAPESEWSTPSASDEWAASDFPLEAGYDDLGRTREFPIDGYDALRANEVLPLLARLDAAGLEMVRKEEAAGKARTSILSRIDMLLGKAGAGPRPTPARAAKAPARTSKAAQNLPIDNYDELTVAQITSRLSGLSVAELRQVRTYEKRHKARTGVLQKIESAIARASR